MMHLTPTLGPLADSKPPGCVRIALSEPRKPFNMVLYQFAVQFGCTFFRKPEANVVGFA